MNEECREIERKISEYEKMECGYKDYCRFVISLLNNLHEYYTAASLDNKLKMIGLIFPENLCSQIIVFKPQNIVRYLRNYAVGVGVLRKRKQDFPLLK